MVSFAPGSPAQTVAGRKKRRPGRSWLARVMGAGLLKIEAASCLRSVVARSMPASNEETVIALFSGKQRQGHRHFRSRFVVKQPGKSRHGIASIDKWVICID